MPVIGEVEAPQQDRIFELDMTLRAALRDFHIQMTDRCDFDSVGLDLTDQFKSYLEVLRAWASLPIEQKTALYHTRAPARQKQCDVAELLGVTDRTVRTYINDGLREMIRRIYDV